jgi:hypothetical protein
VARWSPSIDRYLIETFGKGRRRAPAFLFDARDRKIKFFIKAALNTMVATAGILAGG